MKLRYERSVRVLNDIMGYCHLIGGDRMRVDFDMRDRTTHIIIQTEVPGMTQKRLTELDKLLNIPRQREVEQYYWTIAGEEEIDNELGLAGMMIDQAVITYENDLLSIDVLRIDDTDEE